MDRKHQGIASNWSSMGIGVHSPLDSLVLSVYLLLVVGVGLKAIVSSNRGTVEDFFLAGRKLTWWPIGISLFATNIGIGHLMGLAGIGASSGIAAGAFEWNGIFMLFVLGWIFIHIYIKAGVVTLPEYLRKRFGGFRIQLLLCILYLFLYIFNRILLEICSGAIFLRMVWGMDVYLSTMVLLTIAGMYTITGGLGAVVYTDILHAGSMILGLVLLMGYAFSEVEGYEGLLKKFFHAIPSVVSDGNWTADPQCYIPRPDSFHIFRDAISGDFPWPGMVFGISILSLYYWCADQVFVQRCLAAKNTSHVKGSCILCGYLKLLPMFTIVMPGMISRIMSPDRVACVVPSECYKYCGSTVGCNPSAYPELVVELLPSGIRGLMLCALCASLMSSLTSVFNSCSALFTLNIYPRLRPVATEKELMVTGRFFIIILLAVTIAWIPIMKTAQSEQLFIYMQAVRSYMTPPIAALFLLAMFCKRVNEQGAFWGLILGSLIGIVRMAVDLAYGSLSCTKRSRCLTFICELHYLYFSVLLFVVTLLIMVGVSLATDPISDEYLYRLCWSLRNSTEERTDLDAEVRKIRFPGHRERPGVYEQDRNCFWNIWELFCGLDSYPGPKLVPEKTAEETEEASEKVQVTEGKTEAPEEELEGKAHGPVSRKRFWRNFVNANAVILFIIVVITHICFA